jgi:hypothetical protein
MIAIYIILTIKESERSKKYFEENPNKKKVTIEKKIFSSLVLVKLSVFITISYLKLSKSIVKRIHIFNHNAIENKHYFQFDTIDFKIFGIPFVKENNYFVYKKNIDSVHGNGNLISSHFHLILKSINTFKFIDYKPDNHVFYENHFYNNFYKNSSLENDSYFHLFNSKRFLIYARNKDELELLSDVLKLKDLPFYFNKI